MRAGFEVLGGDGFLGVGSEVADLLAGETRIDGEGEQEENEGAHSPPHFTVV